MKLADWEEDVSEIYSPGEMQVMLPLDYPNTNPTMNPSISYLLLSISANINYSNNMNNVNIVSPTTDLCPETENQKFLASVTFCTVSCTV